MTGADRRVPTSPKGELDPDVATPYDVFLAMKKRRMHRSFDPEPPTKEQLDQLVYAAGRAPTGRPRMRQIMVIDDPVTLATLPAVLPWVSSTTRRWPS